MKKIPLILLSLLIFSFLSASDYPSNSLGQILESPQEDGSYVIKVEGNKSSLYSDDILTVETTYEKDGEYYVKTVKDCISGVTTVSTYKNNLLQSIVSGDTVVSYIYDEESVLYKVTSSSEEIDSIEYYLRSPVDMSLVGVKRYEDLSLYSESMIISEENVLYSSNNLFSDSPFRLTENNEIVTESDGKITVYDIKGQVVRKEYEDTVEIYEYNETGSLSKITIDSGMSRNVYFYNDNEVVREEAYTNGTITRIDEFGVDGNYMIRMIFRDGKHIANALYKENSVSASSIEYVQE